MDSRLKEIETKIAQLCSDFNCLASQLTDDAKKTATESKKSISKNYIESALDTISSDEEDDEQEELEDDDMRYDFPRIAYITSSSGQDWEYFQGRIHDDTGWFPSSIC